MDTSPLFWIETSSDAHNVGALLSDKMMQDGDLSMFATDSDTDSEEVDNLFNGYNLVEGAEWFMVNIEQYNAGRDAKTRGTANPSVMDNPFWKWMVFGGLGAWHARQTFGTDPDEVYAELNSEEPRPVWCFKRWGATRTKIPDGRIICIGGEHEDHYDPDFCIYNGQYYLTTVVRRLFGGDMSAK